MGKMHALNSSIVKHTHFINSAKETWQVVEFMDLGN